jgi:hypothetical protein
MAAEIIDHKIFVSTPLDITWSQEKSDKFAENLKATIRATFPLEARMED